VAPTYITHDWGRFSMSGVDVPTYSRRHRPAEAGKVPSLVGRLLHIPTAMPVSVMLLDLRGRRVARVFDGVKAAGTHRLAIPREALGSGTYILSVRAKGFTAHRRMSITR
jgi:hypothetical protein